MTSMEPFPGENLLTQVEINPILIKIYYHLMYIIIIQVGIVSISI